MRIEKWGELMDDKKKLGELRAGCSVDMTAPGTERRYEQGGSREEHDR